MLSSLIVAAFGVSSLPAPSPVQAFILAGQSNMVGHGFVSADPKRNGGKGSLESMAKDPKSGRMFKRLLNRDGSWRVRDDVWIDYFDRKGLLTVGYGAGKDTIGPELGFGNVLGDANRDPILLIKIAWGGKSLAQDFRPPSSGGTVGPFYTELIQRTKQAVADASRNFPELGGRQIKLVGFGWHQGWNDRINAAFVREYEENMANFIRDVRRDLDAPNLPFVIAETGMGDDADTHPRAMELRQAQAAVAKRPELSKTVAFVSTRPFWRSKDVSPSDQGYHWNSSGETYYLIGDGMGKAMVDLLKRNRK